MSKSVKKKSATSNGGQTRRTVFIVEDHPLFREGLTQVINSEPDLVVCGHAEDAETGYDLIRETRPDLAVVDISLPGKNGLALIKELRQVDKKIKLLVISMHDEALYANRVLRAGGDGYIMKQEDPEQVVHAIHDVLSGHIYVSEEVLEGKGSGMTRATSNSRQPLDELSDSQLEILELLGMGNDPAQIARKLKLAEKAVASELKLMRSKLGMASENELIRQAVCWVEAGEE